MEKNKLIIIASVVGVIIVVALGINYFTKDDSATEKVVKEAKQEAEKKPEPKVEIEILKEGEGDKVVGRGDHVTFHYKSMLEDGTVIDDSYERGATFTGQLNRMMNIKGWDDGMVGMKVGEIRRLIIPSELAYGEVGAGSKIPPNAIIISEIEMIGFE